MTNSTFNYVPYGYSNRGAHCYYRRPLSTFDVALPYGAITSIAALSGVFLTIAATSTAVKIAGICIAIIGSYALLSVILCAIKNAGNPRQFQMEIPKAMVTSAGVAISSIVEQITRTALDALVDKMIYGSAPQRIRIY